MNSFATVHERRIFDLEHELGNANATIGLLRAVVREAQAETDRERSRREKLCRQNSDLLALICRMSDRAHLEPV